MSLSTRNYRGQPTSGETEVPTVSTTSSAMALPSTDITTTEKDKKKTFKLENLPTDIIRYILGFGNHWDLLNVRYVVKSWSRDLAAPMKELQDIGNTLDSKESKEIIETCLGSIKTTQAVLMSSKLLNKLVLDDIVTIACSSYDHAKTVLSSQLFIQKPKNPSPPTSSSAANKIPTQSEIHIDLDKLMQDFLDCKPTIYEKLIKLDDYGTDGLKSAIKHLLRPDLLEEEQDQLRREWHIQYASIAELRAFSKIESTPSYPVDEKLACQAYIARAIVEKSADFARLVLGRLRIKHVFPASRLLSIAKLGISYTRIILEECLTDSKILLELATLSEEHARIVLARNLMTGKLKLQQLQQLARINKSYAKLVINHDIHLVTKLPLTLIKCVNNPEDIKKIALALINDTFYNPQRNPNFGKWLQKNPELAQLTLSIWSMPIRHKFMPVIIKHLMEVSKTSREQILAIKGINKILESNESSNESTKLESSHRTVSP